MKYFIYLFFAVLTTACTSDSSESESVTPNQKPIIFSDNLFTGVYEGPEFENGVDVAHRFSNQMCDVVGLKLKERYKSNEYSIVDLSNIEMSTTGMGTGKVVYELNIPLIRVESRCDAMTSFDHSGGWNHAPAIESRMKQLESALIPGEDLVISDLKTTPEGLQEYWIQWKNKEVQADCELAH